MSKKNSKKKPAVDKHADFVRVVTPRVRKALKAIGLIGNQSGAAYAPTDDEVAHIFAVLYKKLEETEKRYSSKGHTAEDFTLEQ